MGAPHQGVTPSTSVPGTGGLQQAVSGVRPRPWPARTCLFTAPIDFVENGGVRVSAKVDYALRAAAELALAGDGPVKGEPHRAGAGDPAQVPGEHPARAPPCTGSCRASAAPRAATGSPAEPAEISLAEVIRAVEGPIANVRGVRPETLEYARPATARSRRSGSRVRASMRSVLEDGHAGRPRGPGALAERRSGTWRPTPKPGSRGQALAGNRLR